MLPCCSSWIETQRVQSFPGPTLRCSAPGDSSHVRWPPADEAHLWRPAHIHACASVGRGQCRSRPQRLVKSVTGDQMEINHHHFISHPLLSKRISSPTHSFLCNNLHPCRPPHYPRLTYLELCLLLILFPSRQIRTQVTLWTWCVSGVDLGPSVSFHPFLFDFFAFYVFSTVIDLWFSINVNSPGSSQRDPCGPLHLLNPQTFILSFLDTQAGIRNKPCN